MPYIPVSPVWKKRLQQFRPPRIREGMRFGRLRVLCYAGYRKNVHCVLYLCACDCGERTVARDYHLWWGKTKSCGCGIGHAKHGMTGTRTYSSWVAMQARCRDPKNRAYKHYGGRGITVCERWQGEHGFQNFLADMGKRPKGTSIDRIDVNGNYEPGNCRWATATVQANNQRPRKPRTQAITPVAADWADEVNAAIYGVEAPF